MKQGTTKHPLPKDKHAKKSWQSRNAAREVKQADHKANLLLASMDADDAALTAEVLADENL